MEQKEMLEFLKALSNADRLRLVGVLAQKPASTQQIAEVLGMHPQDVLNYLTLLAQGGVVIEEAGLWRIDAQNMDDLPRRLFKDQKREVYTPAPDLSEKSRKVLTAYLNADGSIKQIPGQAAKLQIILDYLLEAFTPGVLYTEKEINMILRRFHLDTASLRRDMIDRGMLQRKSDGSQYWRPA
jgi:hypothetical protein